MADDKLTVSITDATVLAKYKQAAVVCNHVMAQIVAAAIVGARVYEVCKFGDEQITAALGQLGLEKSMAKGVAFPTTCSVNNCVANFSPLDTDKSVLKDGDVVKCELGVHIDGVLALLAHTFVPRTAAAEGAPALEPTGGPAGDAVCAAHYAIEAALRTMRPGKKASEVTRVVQQIAQAYGCNAVDGISSYSLDRYTVEGKHEIANRTLPGTKGPVDFEFTENSVFAMNVVISTGEGKSREGDEKCTIYRRDNLQTYKPKLQAANTLLTAVRKAHPTLPFNLRSISDQRSAKLGISELVKHNLLIPYNVVYERPGKFVAQFQTTVLITPHETVKLTAHPLPFVTSAHSITDPEIAQLLALDLVHTPPSN